MVTNFIKLKGVRKRETKEGNRSPLENHNSSLIIMDIQEKLINVIPGKEEIVWNVQRLADACKIFNASIQITEQNPYKLGKTVSSLGGIDNKNIYNKMDFSCYSCKELIKNLKSNSTENIIITGIETHICILQSCLDFLVAGRNVFIPVDCVGSRNKIDHDTALRRLELSGATLTSAETVIFELCKTANNKMFKDISKIIKRGKS